MKSPEQRPPPSRPAKPVTLDWRAHSFLEALRIGNWPAVADRGLTAARADLRLLCTSTSVWQAVSRVGSMVLETTTRRVPLRIYEPLIPHSGPRPLLVWLHGGGFVLGDLETADPTCRALANRSGAVVVSVDYALAPEFGCVAGAEDAYQVVRWALANASLLGCDPQRVVVGGESAGATLTALSMLRCRDDGGPQPALQVLVYPCTDCSMALANHEPATAQFMTWDNVDWFAAQCFTELDPASPQISPYRAQQHDRLPPALVITAECDLLCDDGEAYARLLRDAGNEVTLSRYDGQIHGFFTMDLVFPAARAAQREVAKAIKALPVQPAAAGKLDTRQAPPIRWLGPFQRAMAVGRALVERLPPTTLLRAGHIVLEQQLQQFTDAARGRSRPVHPASHNHRGDNP